MASYKRPLNPHGHWEVWVTVRNPKTDVSYTEFMYVSPRMADIEANPHPRAGGVHKARKYQHLENFYHTATRMIMRAYAKVHAQPIVDASPPEMANFILHKMDTDLMDKLQAELDAKLDRYNRQIQSAQRHNQRKKLRTQDDSKAS